jgi:hypothetical protein
MIIKAIKTTGLSIALAATFLGAAGSSMTFAQDVRGRDRDRDSSQDNRRDRDDRKDNDRDRDDRKDNDRDRDDRKDNDRDRDDWKDNDRDRDDWKDSHRERFEERRGYRDGMIRGREDALQHRRFNLFGYPRFRYGSSDYREGFRSGYAQAYRRFADDHGRRYGRRD